MEVNRNIEELREIAPMVANAGKQNAYSIPDGYFDSLAESVLSCIKLTEIKYSNPFSIPDDYFDSLADSVINRIRLEEVKLLNPYSVPEGYFESLSDSIISHIRLEEVKHLNPYSVPEGYFESLSDSIISRIKLEEVKLLNPYSVPEGYFASLPKTILNNIRLSETKHSATYSVPAGYFENFAGSVLDKINAATNEVYHELSEVAPLLNRIDKSDIFSVPEGYFQRLSTTASKPEPKTSKVISLGGRIRKWTTYAAAACVLFIIATTTYLYVNVHGRIFDEQLPVEQRISQLDENEIMNYLKDNDGITSGDVISTSTEQDPAIQHLLKNASDEDIQNYLDEYSDPDESADNGI